MESATKSEVDLRIEVSGHKRWLVATQDGFVARVRLPLHIEKMPDEQREYLMSELCFDLRLRLHNRQGVQLATN